MYTLPPGVRLDGGTRAPPSGPALAVGEISEHSFARRLNLHRSLDLVFEIHNLQPFFFLGRRCGRGPRRVSSSSASSFSAQACRPTSAPTSCRARLAPPDAPDKTDFCFPRGSESVPLQPAIEAGAKPLRTSRPAWPGELTRRFALLSKPAAGFRAGGARRSRLEQRLGGHGHALD